MTFRRLVLVLGTLLPAASAVAAPSPSGSVKVSDKQPISVSLDFDAPEGCSDRVRFESGLRERFTRIRVVPATLAAWSLRVRVTPREGGVHGELQLRDAHGETELRAVEGADCTGVVEALSLTAALAIEQTVALVESSGTDERYGSSTNPNDSDAFRRRSRANSGSPLEDASSDVAAAEETQEASNSKELTVRGLRTNIGLFTTRFVAPQTSVGVTGEVWYLPQWNSGFRPEMGIGLEYVPAGFLQPKSDIAVDYRGVVLLGCPARVRLGSTTLLLPCATVDIGRLTVSSSDFEVSTPSRRLQVFTGLEGRLVIRFGTSVELELRSALRLPTVRRKYVSLEPVETLGNSPTVSWLLGLGWSLVW